MGSEDYLHALETMGRILLFTPIVTNLLLVVLGVLGKGFNPGPGSGFAAGLMISAGLFTLVYVSILRFRESYSEMIS